MRSRLAILAFILCPFVTVRAQKLDLGFQKGDSVVLAVPSPYLQITRTGLMSTNLKFDVEGRLENGEVAVWNADSARWDADWRLGGFPPASRRVVTKVKTVNGRRDTGKLIEVTIRIETAIDYRVFAPVNEPQVIRTLVLPVAAADSVMEAAYTALGDRFFVGPLSAFSLADRHVMLEFAHLTAGGTRIGSQEFKGITYLAVTLPEDGNTWNDLRVTRSERIGRLIEKQLTLLKSFAKLTVPHEAIGGLKLEQPSRHGTAPGYSDVRSDQVEAFFPLEAILAFAEADITSQQLVDKGIVLVDGDRVEIDLSKL